MKNRKIDSIIALCAMSFITLASSATSPALSTIAGSFPEASSEAIASIATLSSLTAVPFTILSGLVVGKKIRFRAMALLGLIITTIGGFMPYFATSITQVLVGRAVLGLGTGLLGPIVSTLTLSLFEGKDVAKQFSRNMMSTNLGAVIFQLAGGFLCNYSWRMPFFVYLIVLPVAAIVFFCLPEPERIVTRDSVEQKKFNIREVLSRHVIFWGILYALYMACFYAYVTETSGIITRNGYGDSFATAIVLSAFTAFGVLGGYLFYPVNNRAGMKTLAIGFGIEALSCLGIRFSGSLASYLIVSLFFGTGYGMLAPCISYYLGIKLNPEYRAASMAASGLFNHLGSFSSPFIMAFFRNAFKGSSDRLSFVVGMVFYAIAACFFIFHKNTEKSII